MLPPKKDSLIRSATATVKELRLPDGETVSVFDQTMPRLSQQVPSS